MSERSSATVKRREINAWIRFTPTVSPFAMSESSNSWTCFRVIVASGSGPQAGRRYVSIFRASSLHVRFFPFANATYTGTNVANVITGAAGSGGGGGVRFSAAGFRCSTST